MNRSLALRRLCWKEYRQLFPLIIMLAAIGLIMQLLFLLTVNADQNIGTHHLVLIGLPGLFAAGVGALLVSQERDSKTLYWMASLPILKSDIITAKFLAGFVGLIVVWAISLVLYLLSYGVSNGRFVFKAEMDVGFSILYSVFLLAVGFATAWSFRSTFVGLLALVGVAVAYTVVSNIFIAPMNKDIVSTATMFVCIAVAVWLSWISALRTLAPAKPAGFSAQAMAANSFFDRSVVDRRRIQTPWSALVWQFAVQNRAMLLGLTSLLLVPLIAASLAIAPEYRNSLADAIKESASLLLGPGLIAIFVSISWLGVVTFQGDNLNQRIRFLSERGISPKTVWMTRQVVPLGLLVFAVVAFTIVASLNLNRSQNASLIPAIGLLLLTAFSCMWTIYSVTQWMSQVVRSPVVAAILAPFAACLPFAYGTFLFDLLETPIWVLAITTCIPMIATFRMTRCWMDARQGKRFWLEHGGWLATAILLPTIHFLVIFFTYPTIPSGERAMFFVEAVRSGHANGHPIEISLLARQQPPVQEIAIDTDSTDVGGLDNSGVDPAFGESMGMPSTMEAGMMGEPSEPNTIAWDVTLAEERELQLKHIEQQLSRVNRFDPTPLTSSSALRRLMGDAMLVRARMQDDERTVELLNRYRRNIRLIAQISYGVRLNPTLEMQLLADQNDAWLVHEVQASGTEDLMGLELRSEVVTQLRDKSGRQNARYRALAADFVKSQSNSKRTVDHSLGRFEITTIGNGTRLMSKRHVATVAWHLKQYLNAPDGATRRQAKERLALDWDVPMTEFEKTTTPFSMSYGSTSPCRLWFGKWEQQADAL